MVWLVFYHYRAKLSEYRLAEKQPLIEMFEEQDEFISFISKFNRKQHQIKRIMSVKFGGEIQYWKVVWNNGIELEEVEGPQNG